MMKGDHRFVAARDIAGGRSFRLRAALAIVLLRQAAPRLSCWVTFKRYHDHREADCGIPCTDWAGARRWEMLYCNKNRLPGPSFCMPTHVHPQHHHHPPGQGHPPASISPSILRMSVVERLAIAAALIAVLWAAVIWAMRV
jgi:hypothetical protein